MKDRPDRFLSEDNISHDSEIFDYVRELHNYLWDFVRIAIPGANGYLCNFVDDALAVLRDAEHRLERTRGSEINSDKEGWSDDKDGAICSHGSYPGCKHYR